MPDDSLERKGSSEYRNVIWKTYNWLKILQASKIKRKKQFQNSGLLPVQFMSPQFVCIVGLQHESEWMSFLTELSTWLKHNAACEKL